MITTMAKAETPFREVRARKPAERAQVGDSSGICHCGQEFVCVAIQHNGEKVFYWCPRCDRM